MANIGITIHEYPEIYHLDTRFLRDLTDEEYESLEKSMDNLRLAKIDVCNHIDDLIRKVNLRNEIKGRI